MTELSYAPAQIKAIKNCNKFINLLHGAVRSGKTYIANAIWLNHVYTTDYNKFLMTGHTKATLKRNVLDDVIDVLGRENCHYNSTEGELNIPGNKTIYVVGATDVKAEYKIRGSTFGGCYSDELTLHPKSTLDMIPTRLSVPNAKWFATTNPDSPFHYVYKRFIKEKIKNTYVQKFSINDNPSLTEEFKENLKLSLTGLFFRRMYLGEWVLADGLIYDMVDESMFVDKLPLNQKPVNIIVGADYGTASVTTFLLIFVYDNCIYVADEYVYDSRVSQTQKTDPEFVEDYVKFIGDLQVNGVYLDKTAKSFQQELINSDRCVIREADNDVLNGIRTVATAFSTGKLKILNRCKVLKEEITTSYIWDEKKQIQGIDAPLKENDHCCDALRYAVYSYLLNGNTSTYFAFAGKNDVSLGLNKIHNKDQNEILRDKILNINSESNNSSSDTIGYSICEKRTRQSRMLQPRNFRHQRSWIRTMLR